MHFGGDSVHFFVEKYSSHSQHLSHQDKQQDIEKLVQPLHFYKKNHDHDKIGKSAQAKKANMSKYNRK